jgi:hypothetical protein
MRVAMTGKRGKAAGAFSGRAAPDVKIAAFGWTEFASTYGFSPPERTKSLPGCVERLLDVPRRLES